MRHRPRRLPAARVNAISQISLAVSAVLAASAALAQQAPAGQAVLEEIVVTAQKRVENLQDVPVSIQALDTARLEQLQVADFSDYVKYLPSLSYQSYGPGQSQLYVRGVTNGGDGLHVGSQPLVGVYLDELPVTTIANALDVHIYDVQRVEALSGPQGTLYGSSSMAGTLRIVTNPPTTKELQGGYDLTYIGNSRHGNGSKIEGFVNIPLSDYAAVRLVGFSEHDPGYIDNVAGPAEVYPTSGVARDNTALRERHYNDTSTSGGRAALKVDLNDSWTVTPALIYQHQLADGAFAFAPGIGDLQINRYFAERNDDRWYQASMTVQGKFANFDFVYAGGYFERKVANVSDYSDYALFYDTFYHSAGSAPSWFTFTDNAGNPINPAQSTVSGDAYTKQTHELRLSSPQDRPLRFVAGLFWQKQTNNTREEWRVDGLADSLSVSGLPGVHYMNSQWRIDHDRAVFGELSYDLSSKLTLTGGLRVFDYDNTVVGFFGYGSGISYPGSGYSGEGFCFESAPPGSGRPCNNIDSRAKGSKFRHKLNATYHLDAERMVYATWSTGFRPGGVNRVQSYPSYTPDFLTNYEAGWKTTWLDHRLRFNGAVFIEDWKDAQFGIYGPNAITVIVNSGRARIKGVESDLEWAATEGLTLSTSATLLDAKTTTNSCNEPDPSFSCANTSSNYVLAPAGTRLPVSAKFKMNAIARYQFPLGDLRAHVQLAGVYQSDASSALTVADAQATGVQPGYTTFDLALGLGRGSWSVETYVENVSDERGQAYRYTGCAPATCTAVNVLPIRPRTVGVQFGQKF